MLFDSTSFQQAVAAYKSAFVGRWPEEKYKWQAVKTFQDHWNIDAPNFAAMLREALAGAGNLLASAGHFPGRMIEEFADVAPEEVRTMFRELYDESRDIWQRLESFKGKSLALLTPHGKNAPNHYQDENAITTYLWLRYPDQYYIYKFAVLRKIAAELHSDLTFRKGKYEDNIRNSFRLYNELRRELLADGELKELLKRQLGADCHPDDSLCTLTIDFGYYISRSYLQPQEDNDPEEEDEATENPPAPPAIPPALPETPLVAELKKLLISAKQIILTGAPGTGKTYLAKQLALALAGKDENIEFCQFHPSFDYTDFVEGLRPVYAAGSKEIGFERMDGIFKRFCKKALENYLASKKTRQEIRIESSAQARIVDFLNTAIVEKTCLKTKNGNEFFILDFNDRNIAIEIPGNEVVSQINLPYQEILKIISEEIPLTKPGELKNLFNRPHNTQQDSYVFVICNEVRKRKTPNIAPAGDRIARENFVFIIDEINRGDISKIFGELFYAIDPGYRGERGKITTQYANLIDENDIYHDGFFIPENVYIIGTMNDIDRSVESMDFAIRRRFTWREIAATETTAMWENAIPEFKDRALAVMTRLNEAIEKTDSLSKAFHIGPAYFLRLAEYNGDFQKLWDLHIMSLLKEYLRGSGNETELLETLKEAYDSALRGEEE